MSTGHAVPLPLGNIRVLDLTRAASGPFCTMILGDFGADVVKVEPIPKGDLLRAFGPFVGGEGTYFLSINRNKRSLAVNFRSEEGGQLLRDLAARVDVLVENFKPGVTTSMGLAYEDLRAANPRLVYASITGFGAEGPYGDWPGVDQIAQGMSGLMSVTGTDGSGPLRVGVPIGDLTAGMWAALGILAALMHRQQTGVGQKVDTSLLGALVGLLCVQGQRYLSLGEVAEPVGNHHPVICPYGIFTAKDGPINICAATQEMWVSLCGLLGVPELAHHPDFADNTARMRNRPALIARLDERLATDTQQAWTSRLVRAGIPAGPIYTMDQVFTDPHVRQGGFVETVSHSMLGALTLLSNPAHLGQVARSARRPPPLLGEHSREVLTDFGFAGSQIDRLAETGVIR